jgi:hypothetical protein
VIIKIYFKNQFFVYLCYNSKQLNELSYLLRMDRLFSNVYLFINVLNVNNNKTNFKVPINLGAN